MTIRFFAERTYRGSINLHASIMAMHGGGVAKPLIFEEPEVEGSLTDPFIKLTADDAQALFNQLWTAGVRPVNGLVNETDAQTRHLADMRAIAFAKLNVERP